MDTVSICMPVYNGEEFLREALSSACSQNWPRLEILVVDDGSTDASVDIVREKALLDSRIRLVRNDANLGLVGNWNRCVELARGQWVKFLFQDDLLMPDCVRQMMAVALQGRLFVACDREFIFEGSNCHADPAWFEANRARVGELLGGGGCNAQDYARHALDCGLQENFVGEPTSTLIDRALMQRVGSFNAGMVQLCDVEYWLRLGCEAGVAYVPRPLARFRVHARATTARNKLDTSFASSTLDKLALSRTAARSPQCAELRRQARAIGLDLEAAFVRRAHQVRGWVELHGNQPCGKRTVREVYEGFLRQQPDCAVSPWRHRAWRLREKVWAIRHGLGRAAVE